VDKEECMDNREGYRANVNKEEKTMSEVHTM